MRVAFVKVIKLTFFNTNLGQPYKTCKEKNFLKIFIVKKKKYY